MKRDPAPYREERPCTIHRGETLHHTEMKRECTIQR